MSDRVKRPLDETREEARFLEACEKGTTKHVSEFLSVFSPNIVVGDFMQTPLMVACRNTNYSEAKEIVALLLSRGAFYNICCKKGATSLHYASKYSSAEVVKLLLDAGHFIDPKDYQDQTPLIITAGRKDSEALKIARLLVERGASLLSRDSIGCVPLHRACASGTLEMVMLLGPKKHACINLVSAEGMTALMFSCLNAFHGVEIIPYLIRVGADTTVKFRGRNALHIASGKNASLVKAIRPFMTPTQIEEARPTGIAIGNQDILGILREMDYPIRADMFKKSVGAKAETNLIWSILRMIPPCLDGSQNDFYSVLRELEPTNASLWNMVASVTSGGRHPITGDTILHASVRTGKSDTLGVILSRLPNPFLRNIAGETPLDLALSLNTSEGRQMALILKAYSQWTPTLVRTEWYGPFFRKRAKTFLMVGKRLKIQKDMVFVILRHLANLEYV